MKKLLCLLAILCLLFSLAACSGRTSADGAEEDGQNPVMNFIGVYSSGRCSMLLEADGQDGAKISVTWGSSYNENSGWQMSGTFDPETLSIRYEDCVRTDYVYREDGEIESENVVYENGSGRIILQEGDPLTLTWEDGEEQMADGMTFEYVSYGEEDSE